MKSELERFFDSISFKDKDKVFNDTKVKKVIVHKKDQSFEVFLTAPKPIFIDAYYKMLKKSEKGINGQSKVCVNIVYNELTEEEKINAFKFLLEKLAKKKPSLSCTIENKISIIDDNIVVEVHSKMEENLVNEQKEYLLKNLVCFGYPITKITTNLIVNKSKKEEIVIKSPPVIEAVKEEKSFDPIVYGKSIRPNNLVSLTNVVDEVKDITCEASVFGIEYVTREKVHLINLKITDTTDSLLAKIKFFGRDLDNSKGVLKKIKEKEWYRIHGYVEFDTYVKDLVLNIKDMELIPSKTAYRSDEEAEKRVELHAHTCMSQMDGVVKVKSLVRQAKKFGHEAIAITDHNCLQSFPEAYYEREGIKIIYGVELSVINNEIDVVFNKKKDYNLLEDTFVVFDTETTGFNAAAGDEMIEIGAVKVCNGEILDRFDELISPSKELPAKITEITSITKEMLNGKRSEAEVLNDFLAWIGDLPLIAHNAKFDKSFIDMGCKRHKIKNPNNTILDTLELSRMISPDQYRHNLSTLAKRYDIEFDEEGHHRADYDAEATALIYYKMVKIFSSRGIETMDQLIDSVDLDELLKFTRAYHMTIYAQNAIGLKNLFKLVSLANTKYLYKTPRIIRSEIVNNREGLIIGSGCVNGEIFDAAKNKSEDELREMMSFYDFIEVNPPSICEWLVDNDDFTTKNELLNNIKKIINVALLVGKKVCATGDVHQLLKEDQIYREIIINQRTPNVGRHPLYKPDKIKVPNMYFMNTKEMLEEFLFLEDEQLIKEIVIDNPKYIASLFEEQTIIKDQLYTPKMEKSNVEVEDMVMKKAYSIYGKKLPPLVQDRIDKELKGIINGGFDVIYLIAQKLVKHSNDAGYFVGSRGSVGSSFVATLMGITEVNPLPAHYLCPNCKEIIFEMDGNPLSTSYKSGYDLPDYKCPKCNEMMSKEGQDMPFATFLGFEAEKVPDIDLNFSGEDQASAHDYTKELFGEHNVFRAGTIGTVAFKTAYGFVKAYLEDKNITLRNVEIERICNGLLGVKRTTGQHPGGIIVIPKYMDIFDFSPYQYPADDPNNSWYTTHFDFHAIHDNILKLDILGHDDPTMLKYLKDDTGIDFMNIPFDDKKVLSLFTSPKALGVTSDQINCKTGTLGIPEFGTNFVIRMLEETKPKTFAELVKISGLSHGTDVWAGNARDLVVGKTVEFKDVIGCRDDIMVSLIDYGMEPKAAFKISEFVRKGKASKEPEKWAEMMADMRAANIPEWFITSCGKIKYMFPKAHATAYVMMGFRVAWYKVYKPIYYYSNFFGIRCNDFDVNTLIKGEGAIRKKIFELNSKGFDITNKEKDLLDVLNVCLEMSVRGFSFNNIDLEKSDGKRFIVSEDEKSLYIPFRALDGLGEVVANKIVEERNIQPFTSIEDFQDRCKISTTTIDKLKTLGVLKELPESNQLSLF